MTDIRAIVLISIDEDFFTLKSVSEIKGVEKVYEISGRYDALAIIKVNIDKLNSTVDAIKHKMGVTATNTSLVLQEIK